MSQGAPYEAVDVVVVGAGLAGLACARVLARADLSVAVLEASDGVGGRVRTDVVDGFRCDRGFQLLNPSYPEARRVLDLPALRLQPFGAGVVVARGARRHVLGDPRRLPPRLLPRALAGALAPSLGGPREKLAFARFAVHAATAAPSALLEAPDQPWGEALAARGVTGSLRAAVVDAFLAGTVAERDGETSRRFVELLVRSFLRGTPGVPWEGMQAMPDQLAAALPPGTVRLHTPVTALTTAGGPVVQTADGALSARAVVVATGPIEAAGLTALPEPGMRGLTTFWHAAPSAPSPTALLHLDGDRRGPLVNTVVVSNAAPAYSPDARGGRALVASTVLGADGSGAVERAVREQLRYVYGTSTDDWELVTVQEIPKALTAMTPPLDVRRPVSLGDGLFVAGDHRDTASIQGALVSGRRAAGAVLEHLGLPVPAREPLQP